MMKDVFFFTLKALFVLKISLLKNLTMFYYRLSMQAEMGIRERNEGNDGNGESGCECGKSSWECGESNSE